VGRRPGCKRNLCRRAVSVRLSVCLSRSCIVSKRVNIFSNFFSSSVKTHHSSCSVSNVMALFRDPLTEENRSFRPISCFGIDGWWSVECCEQTSTVESVDNTKRRTQFIVAHGDAKRNASVNLHMTDVVLSTKLVRLKYVDNSKRRL